MDLFHRILLSIGVSTSTYSIDDIDFIGYSSNKIVEEISSLFISDTSSTPVISSTDLEDDNMNMYHIRSRRNLSQSIKKTFIKLLCRLPNSDIPTLWDSNDEAMYRVNTRFGMHISRLHKDVSINLGNMSQVEFIKFLCNSGPASHLINRIDDTYVIDLKFMSEYEVRSDFIPYGVKAVLNLNMELLYIELPYSMGDNYNICKNDTIILYINDKDFIMGYNAFVSTILAYVTIVEHALFIHFKLSSNFRYILHLMDETSDITKLIRPFVFMTETVNTTALDILVNTGGIVERIFGFTREGLSKLVSDSLTNTNLVSIQGNTIGNNKVYTSFKHDASSIKSIIHKFVKNVLTVTTSTESKDVKILLDNVHELVPELLIYDDIDVIDMNDIELHNEQNEQNEQNEKNEKNENDLGTNHIKMEPIKDIADDIANDVEDSDMNNLIHVITNLIYLVSFWHEHVGTMIPYLYHPNLLKLKVYKHSANILMDTKQNGIQGVNLAIQTSSIHMPKITDNLWTNCKGTTFYNKIHPHIELFINDLNNEISNVHYMDTSLLECSVSL